MTENTSPTPEPIQVPPQEPPTVEQSAAPKKDHTRTILEVVGGVVAIALIAGGTIFGFVAGRVSADNHLRDGARMAFEQRHNDGGPQQGPGGMMGGQQGPGGMMDQRDIDPDGDNWTGQNRGDQGPAPVPAPTSPSQAG